jgi:hypothetical protein
MFNLNIYGSRWLFLRIYSLECILHYIFEVKYLKSKVSEWLLFNTNEQFFSYIRGRTSYTGWDDDEVCFVLDQHAYLDFKKQQSVGRLVAPL